MILTGFDIVVAFIMAVIKFVNIRELIPKRTVKLKKLKTVLFKYPVVATGETVVLVSPLTVYLIQ